MFRRELKPLVPESLSPAQNLIVIVEQFHLAGKEVTIRMHTLVEGVLVQEHVLIEYHDTVKGRRPVGDIFPVGVGQQVYNKLKAYFEYLGLQVTKHEHVR